MKLTKQSKQLLVILFLLIIFGISFQRTSYIEKTSCIVKVDTTLFGIKITSKVLPTDISNYLEALVGKIENKEQYEACKKVSLLEGWSIGTPPGNWLWVRALKICEEDLGMTREMAIEIAKKLISDDILDRDLAIKQITEYRSREQGKSQIP